MTWRQNAVCSGWLEHRVAALVVHLGRGAEDCRLGVRDLGDAALQQVAHLGAEGAHRQAQLHLAGDDVGRVAGQEGSYGDDAGVQRRHVARDDGLQRHDDGAGGHHLVGGVRAGWRRGRPCRAP
jgi:hypothetical protein